MRTSSRNPETARADAAARVKRGRAAASAREYRPAVPYLFVLPAFAVYAAFMLYPLAKAGYLSLFEWDGMSLGSWVGLGNYADLVGDPKLRASFAHAGVLILFYCVLPILLGLVVAAIIHHGKVRGLGLFRTIVFLPQVIAMAVVATAWRGIYAFDGPLNTLLRSVGLGALAQDWFGSYTWALPAIGAIGTWVEIGLVTVLLLAGMAKVPRELYEAARLDGCGPLREFTAVTLPAVVGEIAVAATLTIVAALKTFDLVYMTTGGGPGGTTSVPSYQVYSQAFKLHEVGMAAAIGVALTVLIFLINLLVNRFAERFAA
jgi:raffinose/stachyose/melibiose transport system permease protein